MGNIRKDPRFLEALKLFDMSGLSPVEHWGIPCDPHAVQNLRYAAGYLAAAEDRVDAEAFLELVVKQYVGGKYQDSVRNDILRIVKAAQRVGETSE